MQQITFATLIAVWEELFGQGVFWAMVAVAAVITGLYVYVLIRDRKMSMHKFFWAQVSMPVGAVAAVGFVLSITSSQLSDMGGPIDWLVLLAIALVGAVGFAILVYVVQSLLRGPQND